TASFHSGWQEGRIPGSPHWRAAWALALGPVERCNAIKQETAMSCELVHHHARLRRSNQWSEDDYDVMYRVVGRAFRPCLRARDRLAWALTRGNKPRHARAGAFRIAVLNRCGGLGWTAGS